jgi:hypothetical protein
MHRCRHSGSRRHNHGSRCMYKQCTCGLSPRLCLPWTWPAKSTAPELLFLTQRCSCNMWGGKGTGPLGGGCLHWLSVQGAVMALLLLTTTRVGTGQRLGQAPGRRPQVLQKGHTRTTH